MHVSRHALRRLKQRGLVPRKSNRKRAIKRLRHLMSQASYWYKSKSTGCTVYCTKECNIVKKNGTIVTVYLRMPEKEREIS